MADTCTHTSRRHCLGTAQGAGATAHAHCAHAAGPAGDNRRLVAGGTERVEEEEDADGMGGSGGGGKPIP
eukprot:8947055-Pyramimonas_sp.AAC.1